MLPPHCQPIIAPNRNIVSVRGELRIHLSGVGDVVNQTALCGGTINSNRCIEGFCLTLDGDLGSYIEYQTLSSDGAWSPWSKAGEFSGTRGHGLSLLGFCIRLTGTASDQCSLFYAGSFGGSVVVSQNGMPCTGQSGSKLEAIHVLIEKLERDSAAMAPILAENSEHTLSSSDSGPNENSNESRRLSFLDFIQNPKYVTKTPIALTNPLSLDDIVTVPKLQRLSKLDDMFKVELHRPDPGPPLYKTLIAPPAPPPPPQPIRAGTEIFSDKKFVDWHSNSSKIERQVFCCFSHDAVISGSGQVWLHNRLVTVEEFMPAYAAMYWRVWGQMHPQIRDAWMLPVRTIDTPCAIISVHGLQVYGHFLIEMMPRILLVQRIFWDTGLRCRILLDKAAPKWLLTILRDNFGITRDDIEFFDSQTERVRLRQAIMPSLLHFYDGFHPLLNELIDNFLLKMDLPAPHPGQERIFIARREFRNEHSQQRFCRNEADLIEIAKNRYGFQVLAAEDLSWREQLAIFRNAKTVVGQWGSGMHNAIFSGPGTKIGQLGATNTIQSEIGSLRKHQNAYMTKGFATTNDFDIPQDRFEHFLEAICAE